MKTLTDITCSHCGCTTSIMGLTPEQKLFVDRATAQARAHGFAFDLRSPRVYCVDHAQLKIKAESEFVTLMISPDGGVGVKSISTQHDRNLSKFVERLLAWNEKVQKAHAAWAVAPWDDGYLPLRAPK